jgi:thioredoxin reductase (NADPH)
MLYDVIILGSGPAGLTAAIYTVRASLKTLVLAGYKQGGQLMLTTLVENYPGFPKGIEGPELMINMRKQAENLGVEFVDKDAVEIEVISRPFKVWTTPLQDEVFEAKSLIVATGADTKWLNIPQEQELVGRGVSSCAPCDAFFFKGKDVAVVGGGDTAMEEAIVLAGVANSVTIIHRGDSFKASMAMQEKVFGNPKIKVLWNTTVIEVLGKEKVIGLKVKCRKNEVKNQEEYEEKEIAMDGMFVAIGHLPNTKIFAGKIDLDERGFVKRKEIFEDGLLKYWSATNIEGVFVAGDVSDYRYMQAVTAAGFGCIAALDAQRWLQKIN